ncbi:MAG: hypothetical protein AB9897_07900 [Anaerolineaceae bacterium]
MSLSIEIWQSLIFSNKDIESLYNHLLEIEFPQTLSELTKFLIEKKIEFEKKTAVQARKAEGTLYLPKEQYKKGQTLLFPHRNLQKGKVIEVHSGVNPDYPNLEVIVVEFSPGENLSFASNLPEHKLNDFHAQEDSDEAYDVDWVFAHFGKLLADKLSALVKGNEELINIGGSFFPRSLLVDISVGYLNLAEAVLEMSEGGPLTTDELITQIELPTDTNLKLTEFSMNYALQEDPRFDEVGPAGKTLWFLQRLEPDQVQNVPITLAYTGPSVVLSDDLKDYVNLGPEFCDELEPGEQCEFVDEVTISLTYPHWRAGTLPLTTKMQKLFPTAYETPRIKFTFKDGNSNDRFNGWVVRPSHYISGLSEWYASSGFIPGSQLHISRSDQPGEVVIRADKKHNSKEWIRTFLVGTDGNYVFALLKQVVTCSFDERMAIVIPDGKAVDAIWDKYAKTKPPLEKLIQVMIRELAKLNPQGHVHAQEIYAAVNLVKRCPPSPLIEMLFTKPWANHLGDLYFRLDESKIQGA